MNQSLIYHGGSAKKGSYSFFTGGGGGESDQPVILHTNYQYNDSQTVTLNNRFIAYKVICKFSFKADEMGCFIYDTNDAKEFELGIYSESGARIARIGQKILGDYLHEEVQYELQSEIELEKGNQYWLGIWGNGIDIGSEIGFGNLGVIFPGRVHCIDESSEPSLPANISTFNPGDQQVSIWARGFR